MAGFLGHRERPSIFVAINSVKVGFTKENGGNHLVICSSAKLHFLFLFLAGLEAPDSSVAFARN